MSEEETPEEQPEEQPEEPPIQNEEEPEEPPIQNEEQLSIKEPSIRGPSVRDPSIRGPSIREPSIREPSIREPSIREPSIREPSIREPSIREPSIREPSIRTEEQPSIKEPSSETEEQSSYRPPATRSHKQSYKQDQLPESDKTIASRTPATRNDELVAIRDPTIQYLNESHQQAHIHQRSKKINSKKIFLFLTFIAILVLLIIPFFFVYDMWADDVGVLKDQIKADYEKNQRDFQDELSNRNPKVAEELTSFKGELNKDNKLEDHQKIELTKSVDNIIREFTISEDVEAPIAVGQSCRELYTGGRTSDGVYTITKAGLPFNAYCYQSLGGYMVFQRRFDGSTNFNQNHATYASGFGRVSGEYWLGLEILHRLTETGTHMLRVDLLAYDGTRGSAYYTNFKIGAKPGYKLTCEGYHPLSTAGNSLRRHSNMDFSTPDYDADASKDGNCAQVYQGAFWYHDCFDVNIMNFNYHEKTPGIGMLWQTFKGSASLKETTMMVIPM